MPDEFLKELDALCSKYDAEKFHSAPYTTWAEGDYGQTGQHRVYHVCFRVPVKDETNERN